MTETFARIIQIVSDWAIPILAGSIVLIAAFRRVKIYEVFIEGAKEGFNVGVRLIPYLVAILCAIAFFRASGAMDLLSKILEPITSLVGMPPEALPMAVVRPMSGSGALGVMSEILKTHGPDSFLGRVVSVMMGSTETTFYVLAVYFGSVGISKIRHALYAGLLADIAGLLSAVWICRWLFSV
jgi:spore maturation protein B